MIDGHKLRRQLSKAVNATALMFGGGWLLAQYLEWNDSTFSNSWGTLDQWLAAGFLLCCGIDTVLRPPEERIGRSMGEVSPRLSGAAVVLMTGFAAAIFVYAGEGHYLLPGLILLGTVATAAGVWRFATRHAAEIGEARFGR